MNLLEKHIERLEAIQARRIQAVVDFRTTMDGVIAAKDLEIRNFKAMLATSPPKLKVAQ